MEESLKCIINQTLRDIEIIVVNDGSTDNSLSIITQISQIDLRIKIVNQENKGLSEARNAGIYVSHGEYLYFMDSDDILDIDTLENCYRICVKNNLDFIFFDAEILDNKNNFNLLLNYQRAHLLESDTVALGLDLLDLQLKNNAFAPSVWLNFINHQFLINNNLFFSLK